jgi:hypothetical protein
MYKDINTISIASTNPCLLVYMLDQSGSMTETFGNASHSKAQELCNAINNVIYEVGLRCMKSGEIKNRFEIALFAYSNTTVRPGWEGELGTTFLHPIRDIIERPLQATDEALTWVTPHSNDATPMLTAFKNVKELCEDWVNWGHHKRDCHPPIVINVSDGAATDDDANFSGIKRVVQDIRNLQTDYGQAMILNIHISSRHSDRILFPDKAMSNDRYEQLLLEISSPLYKSMIERARRREYNLTERSRGYIFNGNSIDLINFLNIGSPGAL